MNKESISTVELKTALLLFKEEANKARIESKNKQVTSFKEIIENASEMSFYDGTMACCDMIMKYLEDRKNDEL